METEIIINYLKIITPIILWSAIGQTALLISIYLSVNKLLKLLRIFMRKQNNQDTNN
jgi:hypothetical protein